MKKIILSAIVIFTIGVTNAQKAQFGVKGGLNLANQRFTGAGSPSTSTLVGFNVGFFAEIKVADKFSIQPELLYSAQGAKFTILESGVTINSFKMAYINIPVMAKYYVADKFNLELGPQIGFLTSAKANATGSGVTTDVDIKQLFESVDFGLNFGAGYDFTKKVSAGIRYNLGLANIAKTENGDSDTIKNNGVSIVLGYKF